MLITYNIIVMNKVTDDIRVIIAFFLAFSSIVNLWYISFSYKAQQKILYSNIRYLSIVNCASIYTHCAEYENIDAF